MIHRKCRRPNKQNHRIKIFMLCPNFILYLILSALVEHPLVVMRKRKPFQSIKFLKVNSSSLKSTYTINLLWCQQLGFNRISHNEISFCQIISTVFRAYILAYVYIHVANTWNMKTWHVICFTNRFLLIRFSQRNLQHAEGEASFW